jgi:4-amino-4-deoxy-L-arabinose transferase-like glycosyltransferase
MSRLRDLFDSLEARPGQVLVAILALALVVRVAVILAEPGYEPTFDSADYDRHARSIADGDGFPESVMAANGGPSAFRPPLYPYMLGAVYAVLGADTGIEGGRVLGALIGVLVVYLIYLVGANLWGRRVGIVSALVAAVFPPLVLLNAALLSEPIFIALELGIVLAVLAARRAGGDWRWAALAGVLCGLAALTRSNGSLIALLAAGGVWVALPRFSLRGLAAPVAVLLAAVLTVAPWTVRNTVVFDRFVPTSTQSGFALAGAYNDEARDFEGYKAAWVLPITTERDRPLYERADLDEAELDRELRSRALDYATDHPGFVVETTTLNTLRALELADNPPDAVSAERSQFGIGSPAATVIRWTFYALTLFALGGVAVLAARRARTRGPLFMWLIPVLMVAAAVLIIGSSRYRIPVYPFLALLAAIALVDLLDRVRGGAAPTRA